MMSTFRCGDYVSIIGTIEQTPSIGFERYIVRVGGSPLFFSSDEMKMVRPNFQPGERVRISFATETEEATVIAMHGEMLWLDRGADGTCQQHISAVRRLDQIQDVAEAA
ncbi:hypothetical protein [Chelatococcus sp. YT9]|uniref:hypothetical protein n=1 Tax=Chelatococcus sp. YT9 TaxID=2835635 RepID=UPI001BD0CEC2|nr:hypothetical protein [Chelatococcus sp. YT9]MBS7698578.1 hypothetical protein [Chelatococcus sp. YT9]